MALSCPGNMPPELWLGMNHENRDSEYQSVFIVAPSATNEEADQKFEKGLDFLDVVIERSRRRYQAVEAVCEAAARYINIPITGPLMFEQAIQSLDDLMKLDIECASKVHDLERKKILYGLSTRPVTRIDLPIMDRWSIDDVRTQLTAVQEGARSSQLMLDQYQEKKRIYEREPVSDNRRMCLILIERLIAFWRRVHNLRQTNIIFYNNMIERAERAERERTSTDSS